MQKAELKALLRGLRMPQAELARRLGLDPATVCNWDEVPRYAVAYIELYAKVKKFAEEI